jgi:hypothetical protein
LRFYLFLFILIDITFLPYFWALSIPFSMPFVFLWVFVNAGKVFEYGIKEGKYPSLIVFTIILSTIVSYQYEEYAYKNSAIAINFLYIFSLWFYLSLNRKFFDRYDIIKLLWYFYLFVFTWALLYYFNKELYVTFLKVWNARSAGAFITLFEDISYFRFSFIWTDPNNISYVISSLLLFLFFTRTLSILKILILYLMAVFIVLMTMSAGGFIALALSTVIMLVDVLYRFVKSAGREGKLPIIGGFLFITIFGVSFLSYFGDQLMQNDTIIYSLSRFEDNLTGDTAGSGRVEILQKVIGMIGFEQFIANFFVGFGGVTLIGGESVSPHNGHIFWWLSFGLISYVIFLSYFFIKPFLRNIQYSFWLFPFLLGFTVNIMLGELKLFSLFMLLHAYSTHKIDKGN